MWYNEVIELKRAVLRTALNMRKVYFRMSNPNYITIPLSKNGKKQAGKYVTIVDTIDSDLAELNWSVKFQPNKKSQYAHRKASKTNHNIYLHRVIMERKLGRELLPHEMIDHADGDGLNNTRPNLRLATYAQNNHNMTKRKNNTSGYTGVGWDKQRLKWRSYIQNNGKYEHLGYFDTRELAYEAYCIRAKELYGEFANTGVNS